MSINDWLSRWFWMKELYVLFCVMTLFQLLWFPLFAQLIQKDIWIVKLSLSKVSCKKIQSLIWYFAGWGNILHWCIFQESNKNVRRITDCLLFALMVRLGIKEAITFIWHALWVVALYKEVILVSFFLPWG